MTGSVKGIHGGTFLAGVAGAGWGTSKGRGAADVAPLLSSVSRLQQNIDIDFSFPQGKGSQQWHHSEVKDESHGLKRP